MSVKTEDKTADRIASLYGGKPSEWTQHEYGAWIHANAVIGERAVIAGPAVICGGYIHGGYIHGGDIHGGCIHGGYIFGGTIHGGYIHGGCIHGGTIHGGTIHGGTIHGGYIHGGDIDGGYIFGGTIHGGTIHGGTIHGGYIHGGHIYDTPIMLVGILPWTVSASSPLSMSIVCEHHTLAEWRERLPAIARLHNVDAATEAKIRDVVLPLMEQWFADNPNVITSKPAERPKDLRVREFPKVTA